MNKRRLSSPHQFMWVDDNDMLHICNYVTCEDGCPCEKQHMVKHFILEGVAKAFKEYQK